MSSERGTPQSSSSNSFIELLLQDDLRSLFNRGFAADCCDPMGYDLRLGSAVRLVTRGETRTLTDIPPNDEIEIYPGETVIVKTEEILGLPDDVFAIGSPKMKLLLEGLWAHGGKTDPGYKSLLYLGFQNVGNKPCILKRKQKIFHLSFFKIHGKTTQGYTGSGLDSPNLKTSPLEDSPELNESLLEKIKTVEGIKSFRICNQILKLNNRVKRGFIIPIIGLFIILIIVSLRYFEIVAEPNAIIALLLTGIGTIVTQVIVTSLAGWISRKWKKKKTQGE